MSPQAKLARSSAFNVGEDFAALRCAVADEAAAKVEEWLSQQDPEYARGSYANSTFERATLAAMIADCIAVSIDIEDPDEAASCAFDENGGE